MAAHLGDGDQVSLVDETDTLMKGDAEMAEALRGLINSGFTRAGARFIKNVATADRLRTACFLDVVPDASGRRRQAARHDRRSLYHHRDDAEAD